MSAWLTIPMLMLLALAPAIPAAAQDAVPPTDQETEGPCDREPAYQKLNFWLGKWDVFVGEQMVGTNAIEKLLRGCVVFENWIGRGGHQGKSFFFYNPVARQWKQVWVTDSGSMKEKSLVAELDDGGVRFQGTLPQDDGTEILDRTTLTPLDPDRVRQLIEQSRDNGQTWRVGFDAIYIRRKDAD